MSELNAEKVRALLKGISPAPWVDEITDEGSLIVKDTEGNLVLYCGDMEDTERVDHMDAELIALAPDIARAYLAQAKRIKRLEMILTHYADEDSYDGAGVMWINFPDLDTRKLDKGGIARAALEAK